MDILVVLASATKVKTQLVVAVVVRGLLVTPPLTILLVVTEALVVMVLRL